MALLAGGIHVGAILAVLLIAGQASALSGMVTVSGTVIPATLFSGVVRALPVTVVLFPLVYYLSRRRVPARPGLYALVGLFFGLAMLLPSLAPLIWSAQSRAAVSSLDTRVRSVMIGISLATLLSPLVAGALFGYLMRGHYRRYRLKQDEKR